MDVDVDSRPPREHEFSFSFPKATCHQNDPGYGNPGPRERILSLAAALSNGAAERMPRPRTQSPAPVISALGPFL